MSGGHFNDCGYEYDRVRQFADELEEEIANNFNKNEYGYAPFLRPEVIEYLEEQLPKLRKISEIMRHIDYLYAGDHGEDTFMERVKEVENKYSSVPLYQEPSSQILETVDIGIGGFEEDAE